MLLGKEEWEAGLAWALSTVLYVLCITRGCSLLKIALLRVPTGPFGDNWFQAVSVYYSARKNGITYASVAAGSKSKCAWNPRGKWSACVAEALEKTEKLISRSKV